MDRRRYVPPSTEGPGFVLEQRQLPATSLIGGIFGQGNNRVDSPPNIATKRQRVDGLPFILYSYERTRSLPESVIAPIQQDLRDLISLIHNPGQKILLQFNRVVRDQDGTKHFTEADAEQFIHAFDMELTGSGVSPAFRQKFSADMTKLAALDATGPEPEYQLSNDFAIISQLVQVVGNPLPAPPAPSLFKPENIGTHGINLTVYHRPNFTGTAAPDSEIVIATDYGGILATGRVNQSGQYNIKSEWPLPDGVYRVKAYTFDQGYNSLQSARLTFIVHTPQTVKAQYTGPVDSYVPAGPLAL